MLSLMHKHYKYVRKSYTQIFLKDFYIKYSSLKPGTLQPTRNDLSLENVFNINYHRIKSIRNIHIYVYTYTYNNVCVIMYKNRKITIKKQFE